MLKKTSKPSRYSQTISQRDGDALLTSEVTPISDRRSYLSHHSDGSAQLIFPLSNGRIQEINISSWTRFPKMMPPFCDAALLHCTPLSPRSRIQFAQSLSNGWFEYLSTLDNGVSLGLEDIDSSLINSFTVWLNQTDERGKAKWAVSTRSARRESLLKTISALRAIEKWSSHAPSLHVRKNPWPGRSRAHSPTPVLNDQDWESLYLCCLEEAKETVSMVEEGRRIIERTLPLLPDRPCSREELRDFNICLAEVSRCYTGAIPFVDDIREDHPALWSALIKRHSLVEITKYLYPQAQFLIAFALLLAIRLQANVTQLLGSEFRDFSQQYVFGIERLVWRKFKPRAGKFQHRSYVASDDIDNPARIISFLRGWTSRLRQDAPPKLVDSVFLFVPKGGTPDGSPARTVSCLLNDPEKASVSSAWHYELTRFVKRHNLPSFTAKVVRITGLDKVDAMFSGDIRAKMAAGGQSSSDTVLNHYNSGAARSRNEHRIGEMVEMMNRSRQSSLRIDPRANEPQDDAGCATPGWYCLDPYSSPIPGQQQGKLCSAYGACPECPHAQVRVESAYALARLEQLRAEICNSQSYLDSHRWLAAWAPRLRKLDKYWLPLFPKSVITAAKNVALDPLPPLE